MLQDAAGTNGDSCRSTVFQTPKPPLTHSSPISALAPEQLPAPALLVTVDTPHLLCRPHFSHPCDKGDGLLPSRPVKSLPPKNHGSQSSTHSPLTPIQSRSLWSAYPWQNSSLFLSGQPAMTPLQTPFPSRDLREPPTCFLRVILLSSYT